MKGLGDNYFMTFEICIDSFDTVQITEYLSSVAVLHIRYKDWKQNRIKRMQYL